MKILCKSNNLNTISEKLKKFAFSQNEDGIVDLTVGKTYDVFGVKTNKLGKFYLILTDISNTKLPWWMPSELFDEVDTSIPASWGTDTWKGYGKEIVQADPIYFNATLDIEDGTSKGHEAFKIMKENNQ